jgi:hypothetical protein
MMWGWLQLLFWVVTIYGFATAVAVLHMGDVLVRTPMAWLAKHLRVFQPLALLVKCPACLAFWTGLGLSLGDLSPMRGLFGPEPFGTPYVLVVLDGFFALGTTWLLHVTAERLGLGVEL